MAKPKAKKTATKTASKKKSSKVKSPATKAKAAKPKAKAKAKVKAKAKPAAKTFLLHVGFDKTFSLLIVDSSMLLWTPFRWLLIEAMTNLLASRWELPGQT